MRHHILYLIIGFILLWMTGKAGDNQLVLLRSTGHSYKGIPLLEPVPQNDPRQKTASLLMKKSFLKELGQINGIINDYLFREGMIAQKEPLYLLLSGRMGGFPMKGFFLKSNGKIVDKRDVNYIDLSDLESDYARLSSVTQIFPHEQAHVYMRLLTGTDPYTENSNSSDMHYFSIVTDYYKAFNEGYAESWENLSRNNEKNAEISHGIDAERLRIQKMLDKRIPGFERDYRWPFRAGFYRMAMVLWYQSYENLKRADWAEQKLAKYKSLSLSSGSPESRIMYRNSCVVPDRDRLRTLWQAAASEGVISSFFTKLRECEASIPIKEQVMKEAVVMHASQQHLTAGAPWFLIFVEAYMEKYPEERKIVLAIFRETTGHEFPDSFAPEIWLLNKHHRHNAWVMSQPGGSEVSFYTINLNTAEAEDLATFRDIDPDDIQKILEYRESKGYFNSLEELKRVPGISEATVAVLLNSRLDPKELENLDAEGGNMLMKYFRSLGGNILKTVTLLFGVVFIVLFLLFGYRKRGWKKSVGMGVRTFFKVLLFSFAALAGFFLPVHPLLIFLPFVPVVLMINYFSSRKNILKRHEIMISTLLIAGFFVYFLI
jgi:competence ComEA-like helix-hairpin-helix protein